MFGFARKTKPPATLLDEFIGSIYGPNPPKKTANTQQAVTLAAVQLLGGVFEERDLLGVATELNSGPMPYSTYDLAVSVALKAFRDVPPEERPHLFEIQLNARMTVSGWAKERKVVVPLAQAFENALYKDYKP